MVKRMMVVIAILMIGVLTGGMRSSEAEGINPDSITIVEISYEEERKEAYGYYAAVYYKEGPFTQVDNKFFKTEAEAQVFIDIWTSGGVEIEFAFMDVIWKDGGEEVAKRKEVYGLEDFKNDLFDRIDSIPFFRKK